MKKQLLLLFLAVLSLPALAQQSAPQLVAFNQDSSKNIYETSNNGYRIAWTYYTYCTYNTCFNNGISLKVYDSNGTKLTGLVWEKPYVSSSMTQSKIFLLDATVDKDDNLIVVGQFRCKVNFSPNDPAPTYYDGDSTWSNSGTMFLAKYRVRDGHFIWAKMMKKGDTSMFSYPQFSFGSLVTDNSGNIYLLGQRISGDVDINTGTGAPVIYNNSQQFLAKYNSAGIYQTSVVAEAITTMYYKNIRILNDNLYSIGAIDSAGRQTYLLKQYDMNTLATTRRKTFGYFKVDGVSAGRNQRVELVMSKTDIWLIGSGVAAVDIPTSGNTLSVSNLPSGMRAFFLIRMDPNWNLTDARLLHKTVSQYNCPIALGVDSLNNVMIAGSLIDSINASITGGNTWIKSGTLWRASTYLFYYTGSNLALQWAKQIGDTSYASLTDAVFGKGRNIYFAGVYSARVDFSFNGASGGTYTGPPIGTYSSYYARYKWPTANATGIGTLSSAGNDWLVYPNPAATTLYIRSGTAKTDEAVVLSVYSLDGKLMKMQPARSGSTIAVDIAGLAPGNYFLSITNGAGRELHRFVKTL